MLDLGALSASIDLKGASEVIGLLKDIHSKSGIVQKSFKTLADGITKGISFTATSFVKGTASIGKAMADITKQAIEGYSDFEQLKGGVETLFGSGGKSIEEYAKDVGKSVDEVKNEYASMMEAQDKVLSNAANAYKNAGMSANEYMETVTSFAASLTASLGGQTDIAADVADQAIVDMADNANKMGSDLTSIQNAYMGFAKGNYTMLDNLKLGYGGTAREMARLVNESGVLGDNLINLEDTKGLGEALQNVGFAKMIDAIHAVQDEMGITGTTAKEAASTIQGSIGTMKGAYQNLVVGLADKNANLEVLMGQFADSVTSVIQNILPIAEQVLMNLGGMVDTLLPIILNKVPSLIITFLPMIIKSGVEIITSLAQGLVDNSEQLTNTLLECLQMLLGGITQALPQFLEAGLTLIQSIINGLLEDPDSIVDAIVQCIETMLDTITNHLPELISSGILLTLKLATGLVKAIPDLVAKIPQIIKAIVDELLKNKGKLFDAGKEFLVSLWDGFKSMWHKFTDWVSEKISALKDKIFGWLPFGKDDGEGGKTSSYSNGIVYSNEVPGMYERDLETGWGYQNKENTVNNNVIVNNYSPKALDEATSARMYRQSQRQLMLGF